MCSAYSLRKCRFALQISDSIISLPYLSLQRRTECTRAYKILKETPGALEDKHIEILQWAKLVRSTLPPMAPCRL